LGTDDELCQVIVADHNARREVLDSYEAALVLAEEWRTD
jgi:hypothetical protein